MKALDHVSITVRDLRRAKPFYDAVFGVLLLEPGLRPHYHAKYYAAFLEDPEGNRIEAVCHLGE